MATGYVLYNEKAGTGKIADALQTLKYDLPGKLKLVDVLKLTDYAAFVKELTAEDYVVVAGGDGTLNRFVNNVEGLELPCDVLYFPAGSGNDFARDLGKETTDKPFSVKQWICDLPKVKVNGNTYRFLNGVGYGIDGYCCQMGDVLRAIPGKKVDYTAIAIKGLLFHYKPTTAKVTVDGVTTTHDHVWLAPTMHGRYYGGGMYPTPGQERSKGDGKLSVMVYRSRSKLVALIVFPSLFKGEHVKHKKQVKIFSGSEITVEFDRPAPLQVDGETILNVTSYTAYTAPAKVKTQQEAATV